MKILFFTHDLVVEKWKFMPWRTLVEIVKFINENGHNAELISLGNTNDFIDIDDKKLTIFQIRKSDSFFKQNLKDFVRGREPDIIYWPLAWRESISRIKIIGSLGVPLIGYFPGGCYTIRSSIYALKSYGIRTALPYLLESLTPSRLQIRNLKKYGFKKLIGMTDYTAKKLTDAGWAKEGVFSIPPGRDENKKNYKTENIAIKIQERLVDRPYYLFMGPPSGIRGIYELLDAFDMTAKKQKNVFLVCLFRSDASPKKIKIQRKIKELLHKDRVVAVWESIEKEQLNACINNCLAVVLPFVLVPSEIPLTVIESMMWGKPVITTTQSGTGDFVRGFGDVVRVGDVKSLAQIMIDFISNEKLYSEKCKAALEKYQNHPTWNEVAIKWLEVGKSLCPL